MSAEEQGAHGRPSRRNLLGWGGAGLVLGAGAGAATALALDDGDAKAAPAAAVPFHGAHQAGIATPSRTACTSPPSTSRRANAPTSSSS